MVSRTDSMMKHQSGFTIAELIIVVVIAAVLAAIAVPNLSEFVKDNSRATRVNTMVTALNYARGQAVSRNTRVSLCRSSNPFDDCDGVGNGSFESGWIVFVDGGPRGGVVAADGDLVIRVFQPDMGNVATLRGSNGGGAIEGLSFEANGLGIDLNPPAGSTLVSANTIFVYCDDRDEPESRGIVITRTGFPRLTRDTDGDGTDDVGGVELVCP